MEDNQDIVLDEIVVISKQEHSLKASKSFLIAVFTFVVEIAGHIAFETIGGLPLLIDAILLATLFIMTGYGYYHTIKIFTQKEPNTVAKWVAIIGNNFMVLLLIGVIMLAAFSA